jgi:hypothetical protein
MTARRYLTEAEARTLTRGELAGRVYTEMEIWKVRQPRTSVQRAAYDELIQIMHAAYIDPAASLATVRNLLDGHPDGYWETPVASLPALTGHDTTQAEQAMTERARQQFGPALTELREHEE